MRKGRVIYLGKYLKDDNSVSYKYKEIDENNKVIDNWNFKKKIFIKGTVGSIYDCEFNGTTISYSKKEIPTSYIKDDDKYIDSFIFYPFLEKAQEENRQVEIIIKNSKKPASPVELELDKIKDLYKSLSPSKKSAFIGNLIYKITN